jgi:hypothetical protein
MNMMNGMGSMMGAMGLAGWLGALVIGVLLIAAAVALVRLLSPKESIDGGGANIALLILAVLGALAVLGTGGMLFTHWSMGSSINCCG